MPIPSRFNPDQTEMISEAFDDASAQLQGNETDPPCHLWFVPPLAKRIIEMANRPRDDCDKAA
jgi:hypothetical protein